MVESPKPIQEMLNASIKEKAPGRLRWNSEDAYLPTKVGTLFVDTTPGQDNIQMVVA